MSTFPRRSLKYLQTEIHTVLAWLDPHCNTAAAAAVYTTETTGQESKYTKLIRVMSTNFIWFCQVCVEVFPACAQTCWLSSAVVFDFSFVILKMTRWLWCPTRQIFVLCQKMLLPPLQSSSPLSFITWAVTPSNQYNKVKITSEKRAMALCCQHERSFLLLSGIPLPWQPTPPGSAGQG